MKEETNEKYLKEFVNKVCNKYLYADEYLLKEMKKFINNKKILGGINER